MYSVEKHSPFSRHRLAEQPHLFHFSKSLNKGLENKIKDTFD